MIVKVCGITDRKNMLEIAELNPDMMGFIVYPPSPRHVKNISALDPGSLPGKIRKVLVMVNPQKEEAVSLIGQYGFDAIQLHGEEPPGLCAALREHCIVVKALGVSGKLPENINEYEDACDFFLFDAAGPKRGGNGVAFNHSLLNTYMGRLPYLLGGGICPDHAQRLSRGSWKEMAGLDINSCFEVAPGIKDVHLVGLFINAVRQ